MSKLDYTSEELKTKMCKRQCWESADKAGKPTFNWNDAIHNYNCIILGKRHRGMKVKMANKKKKIRKTMAQKKVLRPRSWPECNVSPALPTIPVVDSGVQTERNSP
ncbi:hypothetical protein RclHR1_05580019 [Rhizophagus clarus]|uniref:Uncharacterized protein n=1 Tax=Rhizophagus clarus TaxID=94130 RepID=A0A2Z6RP13_9GLOM|nr:hypothetical protein RclHR1_05580019 [Rhizophagus clarus]